MRVFRTLAVAISSVLLSLGPMSAVAQERLPMMFENFETDAGARWTYVADRVMGGVSNGQAEMVRDGGDMAVRLTGAVSTDNNGGFIQVRQRFALGDWPKGAKGLRISAKGNGETYYVFLRTEGLARVWYSYRFAFEAGADWTEVEMPFDQFTASHDGMPDGFTPDRVKSMGIVAYGKDFDADVSVRSVEVY